MKILSISNLRKMIDKETFTSISGIFKDNLSNMQIEKFKANEKIIDSNKGLLKLLFLIEGKAKITLIHEDGKRSIINFIHKNSFIGELTLVGAEKQTKDVTALSECICISISMKTAQNRLMTDNDFLRKLCFYIGDKYLERAWFNSKQQNFPLKNRLASYILLTEVNGIYREKHTETCEFLNVSYRHLLYIINQFKEDLTLEKTYRGYIINKVKLEELAKLLE